MERRLMKVLLSIKPEYVEKIFSGEKKYEFRKSIFKDKNVKSVIIYSTSPIKKIVGEFEIEKIIEENPEKLWSLSPENTGISKEKFFKYFENREKGYAIKIGKLTKYNQPKTLQDFSIKIAPQSFVYID